MSNNYDAKRSDEADAQKKLEEQRYLCPDCGLGQTEPRERMFGFGRLDGRAGTTNKVSISLVKPGRVLPGR